MTKLPTIEDIYEIVNRLDLLYETVYDTDPESSFATFPAYVDAIQRTLNNYIIDALINEGWTVPEPDELSKLLYKVYFMFLVNFMND